MKTVIIFNAIVNYKCELARIREANTRYILIVTQSIFTQLSQTNRDFFAKIHVLDPLLEADAFTIVNHYLSEVSKEQLRLITNDEYCQPIVSNLCDRLHLPGVSAQDALRFTNKLVMKDALDKAGVRTPHHCAFIPSEYRKDKQSYVVAIEGKIHYPWIAKPISLYGAASVTKITSREAFFNWADKAAHSAIEFEIEEFVSGTLFNCNSIVQNGKILFSSVEEYAWPLDYFARGYPLASIWLSPSDPRWQRIDDFNSKVIAGLQAPDGATHGEYFLNERGELIFLEIAARAPGALVAPALERITGVNVEVEHFKARLGLSLNIQQKPVTEYVLWGYIPKKIGKIARLITPPFKSQCDMTWYVKAGDITVPHALKENAIIFQSSEQACSCMAYNSNFAELYQDFQLLRTASFLEMEDQD